MKITRFSIGFLAALSLSGCAANSTYTPRNIVLPAHIRVIALRPFINKTSVPNLDFKFWHHITEEFVRTGRFTVANDESQADGVLAGEIVRYIKEPLTFDSNRVVTENKLWMLVNVWFIDRTDNVVLWEEPRLQETIRYFVETQPGGITEEDARERLREAFARDIVKRTAQGFGSVTGASGRKISDTPLPPSKDGKTP